MLRGRGIPLLENVCWFLGFKVLLGFKISWFRGFNPSELQRFKISISYLLEDVDPLFQIFKMPISIFWADIDLLFKMSTKFEDGGS